MPILRLFRLQVWTPPTIHWSSPPSEAWDIIIAVVHFQVICETRCVILHIKLHEVEADPLTQTHTDVPVADLFVLILLREARRLDGLLLICQHPTTLLGCKTYEWHAVISLLKHTRSGHHVSLLYDTWYDTFLTNNKLIKYSYYVVHLGSLYRPYFNRAPTTYHHLTKKTLIHLLLHQEHNQNGGVG